MRRLGPFAAVALIAALDALLAAAAADCTCRAQGREFQLGENTCLTTPKGARLATCGMVLNNSSWEFSETPCTVSTVSPLLGALAVQSSTSKLRGMREDFRVFRIGSERAGVAAAAAE